MGASGEEQMDRETGSHTSPGLVMEALQAVLTVESDRPKETLVPDSSLGRGPGEKEGYLSACREHQAPCCHVIGPVGLEGPAAYRCEP